MGSMFLFPFTNQKYESELWNSSRTLPDSIVVNFVGNNFVVKTYTCMPICLLKTGGVRISVQLFTS